ncbi:MAG: hypothetical protein EU539_00540 [Promethearchaeota archaeon]|nr:MAG: hypothetical protein EU539_00540 [Candidatus Lokiarchaeota archaeon]
MVSTTAWFIGGTALAVLIFGTIFGIYFLFKARRLEADLLIWAGILTILTGLFYLGATLEFLSVVIMGRSLDNTYGIHGLLAYIWVAPAIICAMYLGGELMIPKKKWIIVGIYIVLGIIFELFLIFDTMNAFIFDDPAISGEDLRDSSFNQAHPTFWLLAIFLISSLLFQGVGFAIKAGQATGEIKRKFSYLSLGFIIFVFTGALDSFITPGPLLILIRSGMIIYAVLIYLGLKPS